MPPHYAVHSKLYVGHAYQPYMIFVHCEGRKIGICVHVAASRSTFC